jgi:uncharacterized pyridoxamine 5'-phosphate oxidase family protein
LQIIIKQQAIKSKPKKLFLEDNMINYAEILKANPVGVFATLDGNKVYFCTNSEKPVYAQLQANPNVSFCTYPQNFMPVVSVNGKAVFTEDIALKTRALNENPLIKGIYKTPDNPVFKIFYIDVEEVETFSFEEGSKTYTF